MKIKQILEQLETFTFIEEQLNEMAITKENSGYEFGSYPLPVEEIIDKCFDNYSNKNTRNEQFYSETDLTLSCIFPKTEIKINEPITIIYGNELVGIRHIIEQRKLEFNDRSKCVLLSEDKVRQALNFLPEAVSNGTVLLDYNKNNVPYGDRIILDYKGIYYIILIAQFDGQSNITTLITMFKPSNKYRKRIEDLNK